MEKKKSMSLVWASALIWILIIAMCFIISQSDKILQMVRELLT